MSRPETAIDPNAARVAREAVPGIPCDAEGPVFREPWEAQAFAMTLALHQRGLFTWSEWAQALGAEIRRAQGIGDPDTGETYYLHWLAALEGLVAAKGVASTETLTRYRDAWDRAADRTPHGEPIVLRPEDFGGRRPGVAARGASHPDHPLARHVAGEQQRPESRDGERRGNLDGAEHDRAPAGASGGETDGETLGADR